VRGDQVAVEVQPNLADGDYTRLLRQVAQGRQRVGVALRGVVRVDADSGAERVRLRG
jgi:hypothetical protein